MACADDSDGLSLRKDQYITSVHHNDCKEIIRKWIIAAKIGEGGYGSVYKVKDEQNNFYAMKVEKKNKKRDRFKLSMEYHILKKIQNMPRTPGAISHFTETMDRGKKEQFCFIIMSLLGESLADLRKKRMPPIFSLGTAYGAGIQCLEAIREMHSIGYIHRDIKPGNYAIGKDNKRSMVYILDFGIARKIINDKGELKAPRAKVPFKGTIRYAPIACHRQQELGMKDDAESWLYMVIDFANPEGCNWRGEKNKEKVLDIKLDSRTPSGRERLFRGLDMKHMSPILDYIDETTYCDRLDYGYVIKLVQRAARHANVNTSSPYDWEKDGIEEAGKQKEARRILSAMLSQSEKPIVTQTLATVGKSMKRENKVASMITTNVTNNSPRIATSKQKEAIDIK